MEDFKDVMEDKWYDKVYLTCELILSQLCGLFIIPGTLFLVYVAAVELATNFTVVGALIAFIVFPIVIMFTATILIPFRDEVEFGEAEEHYRSKHSH